MPRVVIKGRTAHGAQQHGTGRQTGLDGVCGQRIIDSRKRRTADEFLLNLKRMAESPTHSLEHENSLLGHFRPNSIPRQNRKIQIHFSIRR